MVSFGVFFHRFHIMQAPPADFPPRPTVYQRFALWERAGATQRLLDGLRDRVRLTAGRVVAPSAAIADSQSLRAAETVGKATRGFDAGRKVQGRKRHIVVDSVGLLLAVLVTPASTQDRVAARSLLRRLRDTAGGRVSLVWADGGYTGTLLDWARTTLGLVVEIVQRPQLSMFTVLPRRWVVERTLAWITGHRRCAPRLRTPAPPPRSHGPLGHGSHHRPPTHVTAGDSCHRRGRLDPRHSTRVAGRSRHLRPTVLVTKRPLSTLLVPIQSLSGAVRHATHAHHADVTGFGLTLGLVRRWWRGGRFGRVLVDVG